jgi:hypothetical protein
MALEKVRADTMGEKTEENAKYIKTCRRQIIFDIIGKRYNISV